MSMNFKKTLLKNETYMPKDILKHQHDYNIKCLLEITNVNNHASGNYYNKKEYHYVLKCKYCNSFVPDSKPHNFSGSILDNNIDWSLPLIKASTNQKNPHYEFSKLFDIKTESN